MKIKNTFVIAIASLLIISCKDEEKQQQVSKNVAVFDVEKDNALMLHSSYPDESVKWDKLIASFNNQGGISHSSFIINFKAENFLNKHVIDSAFVVLTPYPEESYGNNKLKISILDGVFRSNFNWNDKPVVNEKVFTLFRNIEMSEEKKIKIDVTNLAKFYSSQYGFNLPLIFSLQNENLTEQTFASFYSNTVDVKEVHPKLEVYYKD